MKAPENGAIILFNAARWLQNSSLRSLKMKYQLNITFSQKDQVKALAQSNNTRIQWDAASKKWYWEGESIPAFLATYANQNTTQSAQNQHEQVRYYLCRGNTIEWYTVDYVFDSKSAATAKMLEIANDASDWEDALIASSYTLVTSEKKISVNKNINTRWMSGIAHFSDATNPELKAAYARLQVIISEE